MKRNYVSIKGRVALVVIAMLLLMTESSNVRANDQSSAATAAVKIDNFSFEPQTLVVPVGTNVTWTNRDDISHTSVSTEGVWKSKVIDTNETFSYQFTKAVTGTFPYCCAIHPEMTGKIVVH